MKDSDLDQFDPTREALAQMVEATKGITAEDLEDKKQLEVVRRARIDLKNARVSIEKKGKELREDATKFAKAVIAKENELIGIIEPEEDRLKAIEEAAETLKQRRLREAQLPYRRDRLAEIGDDVEVSDETLNGMENVDFSEYLNRRVAAKNQRDREESERLSAERDAAAKAEADRVKAEQDAEAARLKAESDRIEAARLAVEAEKERIAREEEAKRREEAAREDERRRAAEEAERKERERIEAEAAAKKAAQKAAAEEKAKIQRQERYRAFRKELGWTEATKASWKEEVVGNEVILWKKAGSFQVVGFEVAE